MLVPTDQRGGRALASLPCPSPCALVLHYRAGANKTPSSVHVIISDVTLRGFNLFPHCWWLCCLRRDERGSVRKLCCGYHCVPAILDVDLNPPPLHVAFRRDNVVARRQVEQILVVTGLRMTPCSIFLPRGVCNLGYAILSTSTVPGPV